MTRAQTELRALRQQIEHGCQRAARPITLMEVCGTHTMSIASSGLRSLLPEGLRLVSGPGCPVCVTAVGYIDHAVALALQRGLVVATFGDLMRVPGSDPLGAGHAASDPADRSAPRSLIAARAAGGDVRVVYSAHDALQLARRNPDREVVFLAVGFETTAPTIAATLLRALNDEIGNFSLLVANKTIPGAMVALAADRRTLSIDGFLCPGHVSVIIGPEPYQPLAAEHGVACAVAGFEPVEILRGLASLVTQIAEHRPRVDNCYAAVRPGGNPRARAVLERVFQPVDAEWRGLGCIPGSGLALAGELVARFDAARRFPVDLPPPRTPRGCRCGEVLRGVLDPADCSLFGSVCTPETPVGACMVSSEGSCAARMIDASPARATTARSDER